MESDKLPSSMEQLLSVPEEIDENLSSNQIIEILDYLLYEALYPMLVATNRSQEWLAEMMPLISFDSRRKLSGQPKEKSLDLLFKAAFSNDPKFTLRTIKRLRLERRFVVVFLERLHGKAGSYLENHRQSLRKFGTGEDKSDPALNKVEALLGADRVSLYSALQQSKFWLQLYNNFRWMIAQKYYKLAWQEVLKATALTHMVIDQDALFKNYVLAILKAIDKYDAQKGTITGHIRSWFKNANINPDFDHQYGIGTSMPASARRALASEGGKKNENIAYNFDELPESETFKVEFKSDIESQETMGMLARFKPLSKRLRFFMLNNGVEYQLSAEERYTLAATLEEENYATNPVPSREMLQAPQVDSIQATADLPNQA